MRRHCSKVPCGVQLSRQPAEMTHRGFSRMLWIKPLTPTLSRWDREKAKEVVHGWTGEQSCPDYGRWGYERHRSGHSAQASGTGRGHCLDRSTAVARGSAAGRGQEAVAWHRERG